MVKLSIEQSLAKAKSLSKKGRVADAQLLYLNVLKAFPNNKKAQQGLISLGGNHRSLPVREPPQTVIDQLINLNERDKLNAVVRRSQNLIAQYPRSAILWNMLGAASAQLGKFDQAVSAFKKVISLNPNLANSHYNLGNAFKDQGKFEEAIDSYAHALELKPDYKAAYNNLVITLSTQGHSGDKRLKTVLENYDEARKVRFKIAEKQFKIAYELQMQFKLDEAIDTYKKTISIWSDYADAYYNMGVIFKDQGKLDDAIDAYKQALAIKPDYAVAYINLGNALGHQAKFEEAIEAYKKVLTIKPDYVEAFNNMGNALRHEGKLEEALEAYKKALAIKPDYADAYCNMGVALKHLGKIKEAIEAYNKALSIRPDYVEVARNLVKLPIGSIDDKTILRINDEFTIFISKIEDQSQKLFFEANLLSQNGKYDEAFEVFVNANRVKFKTLSKSVKSLTQRFNIVTERITDWSPNLKSDNKFAAKKLFLLGPSRSGKSSLENLLVGHPKVYPMYENINLNALNPKISGSYKSLNLNLYEIFYHDEKRLLRDGYNLVTSTSPESIFYIDQLLDNLENSFCILVKREEADIACEIFTQEYATGNFFSYNHSSIQHYLSTYNSIWNELKIKVPQCLIEIEYEDILINPQKVLDQISQFTGVNVQLDGPPQQASRMKISPFRDHYASRFNF